MGAKTMPYEQNFVREDEWTGSVGILFKLNFALSGQRGS